MFLCHCTTEEIPKLLHQSEPNGCVILNASGMIPFRDPEIVYEQDLIGLRDPIHLNHFTTIYFWESLAAELQVARTATSRTSHTLNGIAYAAVDYSDEHESIGVSSGNKNRQNDNLSFN